MLILEGADCLGKTTAAKRLCELGGLEYRHMSRPPDGFDHVAGYLSAVGPYVHDRFHLGSIVYGRVLGGGSFPTASRLRVVQEYLRWQGCLVIVFTAQRWWLQEQLRANTKKEMYSTEKILDANETYMGLVNGNNRGSRYCDLSFDVTNGWLGDDELKGLIHEWSERWYK